MGVVYHLALYAFWGCLAGFIRLVMVLYVWRYVLLWVVIMAVDLWWLHYLI